MSDKLFSIYYDVNGSNSFFSIDKYDEIDKDKTLNKKEFKNWLINQESYSLHKRRRINFRRSKYVLSKIDRFWQADLIDLNEIRDFNKNHRFLLTVIDTLSKYAWIEILRDKTNSSVINAFKNIFLKGRRPQILITDGGKEFDNKNFEKFLNHHAIKHYITRNTEVKAAVVERFNRTIKEKLYKYFTSYKTKKYLDIIDSFVNSYNNTKNSRTKFKPIEVNKNNERKAFLSLNKFDICKSKNKLKIGDKVRILNLKNLFTKGYKTNWTIEIFTVSKILNTLPIRYKITDDSHQELIGSFYKEELLKIS